MYTSRRAFLCGGASLLIAATMLAACQTPPTPAQVATDLTLVAQSFKAEMGKLQGIVPASAQPAIAAAVDDMSTAVNAFAQADKQAAQQDIVHRVEADIGAVFSALPTGSLPPWVQTLVNDVNALLPVIELAVGLITAAGRYAAPHTWAAKVSAVPTVEQARLDLSVIAAGRL